MLENYGNSPGIQAQITKAHANTNPTAKKPLITNATVMENFTFAGKLGIGGDITFSQGRSYDKNGKPTQCYGFTPCASGGAEGKLTGSLSGSYTNASSAPGISTVTQICGEGSATPGVGVTAGVCLNRDGSTTGSAGASFGASAGVSGKVCQAITYCPGD